jgi:hypothetical protein
MNRLRLPLLLILASLALALPGTAQAASDFKFLIVKDICQANGGDFGEGHHKLTVRVEEQGKSGATKFTLDARVMHRKKSGGEWTREFEWDRYRATFPNDSDSYFHQRYFAYDPKDGGLHKIVVVIRVWQGSSLLASRTLNGTAC